MTYTDLYHDPTTYTDLYHDPMTHTDLYHDPMTYTETSNLFTAYNGQRLCATVATFKICANENATRARTERKGITSTVASLPQSTVL